MQREMGPQVDAPPLLDQIQPLFVQLELRDDAAAPLDVIPPAPMAPSPYPPASAAAGQEPAVMPALGVLTGSQAGSAGRPGGGAAASGGASYPMCQVEDCRADLTHVKAYYRRHRVCQTHSKTSRTLVANQTQRFCQMCSRFHRLAEFDENRRSCRRRLAGHIARRRRGQPGFPAVITGMQGNLRAL